MKSKVFNCRTDQNSPDTPVTVHFTQYIKNGSLAVRLNVASAPWEIFSIVTVNLPISGNLPKNLAYVDTNNCPWAEEFLKDNNIAEDTRISMPSGFCNYPLYKFNLDSQWETGENE